MNSLTAHKALLEANPKFLISISHQAGQQPQPHTDLWVQQIPIVGYLCRTWVSTVHTLQEILMRPLIQPNKCLVEQEIPIGPRQIALELKDQQMEPIEVSFNFRLQSEEALQPHNILIL